MKKLKIFISFIFSVAVVTSCNFFNSKDDYQSLVKKIEINPEYEMQPPIAKNIFIQKLEKPDGNGNNFKFIAEFEKEKIKEKY
ncbi:hypothetical protein [Sphingobacterium litopenaei]|uniref:Lipoprotein n=1 Tax=Sphingobacterium litopenaei TaxID=2763500 RepID=A0ABR7YHA0_9SPHI|nr:hypothetical protein [Sphingobacterium litopenaei]MBD1430588.1 hypothetical protein [Sphingobacterium litopenaei]